LYYLRFETKTFRAATVKIYNPNLQRSVNVDTCSLWVNRYEDYFTPENRKSFSRVFAGLIWRMYDISARDEQPEAT
jgi:hypothetical protein